MTMTPGLVRGLRSASGHAYAETLHRVHVAIVSLDAVASHRLVAQVGDTALETPLRSCAKPFQALGLFTSGAVERFDVSAPELALACASHEGSWRHLELVGAWLSRLGLGEEALQCGAHIPGDAPTAAELARRDEAPRALHNNCSGKHTGMLATALALGATTRDYLRLQHPVQALVRKHLSLLSGLDPEAIAWAVDGCSAPTPIMPLERLARAAAALAGPGGAARATDDATLVRGLTELRAAMMLHADLVGGNGVLDSLLMRSVAGLVAKRGADGVYLLALERSSLGPVGIALKIEDGHGDARTAAVMAVLDQLDALPPAARASLAAFARPPRKNHRGLVIGAYEADVKLVDPLARAQALP